MKVFIVVLCYVFWVASSFLTANVFTPSKISRVALPVKYSAEELKKSLNRVFLVEKEGVLFEDNSFTNNNIKIKSTQTEDLEVFIDDGVVKTVIPISTEAVYLFEKDIHLDFFFFEKKFSLHWERKLDFEMLVTFETTISETNDFKIVPRTSWKFEWKTFPFIHVVFFKLSVLGQVEPIIENVLKNYAKNRINKVIVERVDLKKIFQDINDLLVDPILINEEYGVYNYIDLKKIVVTDFLLDKQTIGIDLNLELFSYFSFSKETLAFLTENKREAVLEKLPSGKNIKDLSEFDLYPVFILSPEDSQNIIFKQMSEKRFVVGDDDFEMRITEIYVKKALNTFEFQVFLRGQNSSSLLQKLSLIMNTSFYLNKLNAAIELVNFSYSVNTKSSIVKLANFFNQKNFENVLKTQIEQEFNDYILFLEEILVEEAKTIDVTEKSTLGLKINKLNIEEIEVIEDLLLVSFSSEGEVLLDLRNLF